jgi:acetylornithine deacetylase
MDPTIALLRELVAIDSVNPSLVPGGAGEGAIAAHVADVLRRAGADVQQTDIRPGRPNVVAVVDGPAPGRDLILCAHLDTVGVEGMAAPFDPVVRDGRLYGRGAQDMKGGLAAILGAVAELTAGDRLRRGRVIVAAVIDEEFASLGAEAFVAAWRGDAAVVTEPTDLRIGIAHKGFAWIDVETAGRAAHGSRPRDGRDAILRMGRVLGQLETLDRRLQAGAPHPLLGTASLHASLIEGGRELSSYPDACRLQMERRLLTGESADDALGEVQAILARLKRDDPEFDASARLRFARPPHDIDAAHDLTALVAEAVRSTGREPVLSGVSFWADTAILGQAGVPALLFGPGGAGLHGPEEYVAVDEVIACRDALVQLALAFC